MSKGPFLIVPENDPDREFMAADLDEAHRICQERGYGSFDVWTAPGEKKIMAYMLTGPDGETGLAGDLWLAQNAHRLVPGITSQPAIIDDGSTMIQSDVTVKR